MTDEIISKRALETAQTELGTYADLHREEGGPVPAWIIAARHAIRQELKGRGDEG